MAKTIRRTRVVDGQLVVEEIVDDSMILTRKKAPKMNGGDFVFVFQKAMLEIVKNGNLTKNAYRLLVYLIAKTEFEKEINTTLYQIAKELNLDQSSASKGMKVLEDINIVVRNKNLRTFRLNYELAFKGNTKTYKKLQFKDNPLLELKPSNQTNIFQQIEESKKTE